VGTPLIGRHASAAGNSRAAAPPIRLDKRQQTATTESSDIPGITNAAMAETEMRNAEMDIAITSQQNAYAEDGDKLR